MPVVSTAADSFDQQEHRGSHIIYLSFAAAMSFYKSGGSYVALLLRLLLRHLSQPKSSNTKQTKTKQQNDTRNLNHEKS